MPLLYLLCQNHESEREFFVDNLLVRDNFIIVMIRWTGLAPWEFEFPFPGSLTSTFLVCEDRIGTSPPRYHMQVHAVYEP